MMASETTAPVKETKAVRLRRLWRSRDLRIQASGIARARPVSSALADTAALPRRGLTARELIGMARAARGVSRTEP